MRQIIFLSLFFILQFKVLAGDILINQSGYINTLPKYFYATSISDSFYIIEVTSGLTFFSNEIYLSNDNDPATGLTLYGGDFSSIVRTGQYYILTSNGDSSDIFSISPTAFKETFNKSLRGLYFQRCGTELSNSYAGIFNRSICHIDDGYYHSSTNQTGQLDAAGGWHDAGDYGKYVVNAGITLGTLLLAYELFPERFSSDDLNIPESNNGIPDILDECKYELEWFLKMQNPNGGVYFKLTKTDFESMVMPADDIGIRYIYVLSSTATADFSAVMARAARVFANYDQNFASLCLNAAAQAWNFLISNPTIVPPGGFTNPPETFTGVYGDTNDKDERLWAAAELFETTGSLEYLNYFNSNYNINGLINSTMYWGNVKNLAYLTYLFSIQSSANQSIKDEINFSLISYCNNLVNRAIQNGFGVTINPGEYNWGCNSTVLNNSLLLILGYQQTGNYGYYYSALMQINYILGMNAHNFSFVTGIGIKSVMNPHHRPSIADGIAEPVPGLLAGGPDQYLSDPLLQSLFNSSTPPALCYVDHADSYASNEIAINWNAPLIFVLGYFNGESVTDIRNDELNVFPNSLELFQNYPNPFNPNTVIKFQMSQESHVALIIFDSLGQEVARLIDEMKPAGNHSIQYDAEGIPSGIYFYKLKVGSEMKAKKMILLK